MYHVVIHRQAKKKLISLAEPVRARIAEQINRLAIDPDDERLQVKKLKGTEVYRMRVGQWRVLFERDDLLRIISVGKIGPRGDVYK